VEAAGPCTGLMGWLKSDRHTHLKEQRDSRLLMGQTEVILGQQMERLLDQARAVSSAKASGGPPTSPPSSREAGRTTRPRIPAWRWQAPTSKQSRVELKGSDMVLTGKAQAGTLGSPNRNNQA